MRVNDRLARRTYKLQQWNKQRYIPPSLNNGDITTSTPYARRIQCLQDQTGYFRQGIAGAPEGRGRMEQTPVWTVPLVRSFVLRYGVVPFEIRGGGREVVGRAMMGQ